MSDDLIDNLHASIARARNWAVEGWSVTFGPNQVEVASLPQALELPREFPYREEAVAYWRNVEGISEEVTAALEGALAALEGGDYRAAENKLYFAQYFEKPLEKYTQTSRPVYEEILRR